MGEIIKKDNRLQKSNVDSLSHLIKAVEDKIVVIRGRKVIADADVAWLYGVETKRVNEAMRNNEDKFPENYMFELTDEELQDLRSKISSKCFTDEPQSH